MSTRLKNENKFHSKKIVKNSTRNIFSPNLLLEKKSNKSMNNFYTPKLASKSNANLYNRLIPLRIGKSNFKKRLKQFERELKKNKKKSNSGEEENKENLPNTKKNSKNDQILIMEKNTRKIKKIKSLFICNNFKNNNFDNILKDWKKIEYLYQLFLEEKNIQADLIKIISEIDLKTHNDFTNCFSDYNLIKNKYKNHTYLYIWSLFLMFLTNLKNNSVLGKIEFLFLKDILRYLIKNTFYLSLILIKAVKNDIINLNMVNLENYVKSLQIYQFPTGIALIKTLKYNNKLIYNTFLKILESINLSLCNNFEKTFLLEINCAHKFSNMVYKIIYPFLESSQKINKKIIKSEEQGKEFTLVLDLDETLIHFESNGKKSKFLVRPYTYDFINNLSKKFEIIIFTAAQKDYADWILDKIDKKKCISRRFYRDDCKMSKTSHLKDLCLLNKKLNKMIIVDNFPDNFSLQRSNGICIKSWYNDTSDKILFYLEKSLLEMVEKNPDDVRNYLQNNFLNTHYKGFAALKNL